MMEPDPVFWHASGAGTGRHVFAEKQNPAQ